MKSQRMLVLTAVSLAAVVFSACKAKPAASPVPSPSPEQAQQEDTNVIQQMENTGGAAGGIERSSLGEYVNYTPELYQVSADRKRVLFFHASWCPTCKKAHEEFTQNVSQIPNKVVVFKTDYDTEKALKEKYGITYQHTFVLVDENGEQLKKWNGGGVEELINQVK